MENVVLKGFIVPPGYVLQIQTEDGRILLKEAGEHSGSQYSFQDVVSGNVQGWQVVKVQEEPEYIEPPKMSDEFYAITTDIRNVGGDVLLVGGVVRDAVLGTQSKDVDIEVYGLDAESLKSVLSKYGKVNTVGVSFGIIKLSTETDEYDFSLPRRESKEGQGHRGFIVEPDPTMSPRDAAQRRDFTFNAMAMTPEGRVFDYYGGMEDLEQGILRHTSEKFAEDPLRVLRGFQFASRFNMDIAPETADLSKELKAEYHTIAKERIWEEWKKWGTKGVKPSKGLEVLRKTGWLEFYPEIYSLIGVPQDAEWHPEGDVYTHTLHVVDAAAEIADRENLSPGEKMLLVMAALCHDFGKVSTTEMIDGRYHAYGHDKAGAEPTRTFMERIGAPVELMEHVVPLVEEHMSHINEINPRTVRRLATRLHPANIQQLVRVIEADHSGRPPLPREMPERAKLLADMAQELKLELDKPKPLVQGRHLLKLAEAGRIPAEFKRGGPHFKETLDNLFEAQLNGVFQDEASGIEYLVSLLNEDETSHQAKLVYLAELSTDDQLKLVEYGNKNGLSETDLINMTMEQLRAVVSN